MTGKPLRIFLCDLTHDTVVLVSDTIPINIGFIAAYAKKTYGDAIAVSLFKYPQTIIRALQDDPPDVIAFSNYSWNSKLSERIATIAKELNPRVLTAQGGTNFPHKAEQQRTFLQARPSTDVYIELESEVSFAALIGRVLEARDGGPGIFEAPLPGCAYIAGATRGAREPVLVKGPLFPRIKNLDEIPSPYLTGVLDHFFDGRLTPFLETNRGCPFLCSFCHTGAEYFNKTNTFSLERVVEEIAYIAPRVAQKGIVNLHVADTNFGMYKRDREICEALLASQKKYGWPRQIMATTGKNNKARVIEITKIMGNVFSVNMSVQTMDPDVLVNIKRDNIRLDDYKRINHHLNEQGRSTKGEVIIGLPGETKESYVRGVEQIIGAGVSSVCSYSLMLLHGTEFQDPEYRERFNIRGKYRIVPLDFGEYGGERVFDTEEVCISTSTMSFADYLWIRGLSLFVEVLHNNRPFEAMMRYGIDLGLTRFQLIKRTYDLLGRAPMKVREVVRQFMEETQAELWDSEEALRTHYCKDENYAKLVNGEAGGNLIYKYKAISLAFANRQWAEYLGMVLSDEVDVIETSEARRAERRREIACLVEFTTHKLDGVLNVHGNTAPREMASPYAVVAWLKNGEGKPLSAYALDQSITYRFEFVEEQVEAREDYFRRYGTEPSGLSKIVTRVSNVESLFRRIRVLNAEDEPGRADEAGGDEFVRYALSN